MKGTPRNTVNEAVWSRASSPEPTRANISGTIVNTHCTATRQEGTHGSILPRMRWKHVQGGSGPTDTPLPTAFDTLPLLPSSAEAAAGCLRRSHTAQMRSRQEYTTQELARDAVNEWERIRPLLERVLNLVEKGLNKKVDIIETAIETLKTGEYNSRTVLAEIKAVSEGDHLSLQAIQTPLEESKEIIQSIRNSITTLNNAISLFDDDTWATKSVEASASTKRHLKTFEIQVEDSEVQFDALRLVFLEKYVKDISAELSDLRYVLLSLFLRNTNLEITYR